MGDTHPTVFSSLVIPTAVCFGLYAAITAFNRQCRITPPSPFFVSLL